MKSNPLGLKNPENATISQSRGFGVAPPKVYWINSAAEGVIAMEMHPVKFHNLRSEKENPKKIVYTPAMLTGGQRALQILSGPHTPENFADFEGIANQRARQWPLFKSEQDRAPEEEPEEIKIEE